MVVWPPAGSDDNPTKERLFTLPGDSYVGPAVRLVPDAPTQSAVNNPSYTSLKSVVRPMFSKFATTWTNPQINPNPANLQAQVAKPTSLSNDDATKPFVFNPTITYEYEEAFETMV